MTISRGSLMGGAMLLAGVALVISALWPRQTAWQIEKNPRPIPTDLTAFYQPSSWEKWQLRQRETGKRFTVTVAFYTDHGGQRRQVLLPEPASRRWQNWLALGTYLREQIEPNALILSWWDNGQRIDFFSGRTAWVRQPPAEAFADRELTLWKSLSGGLNDNEGHLAQLAHLWTSDSKTATIELSRLASGRPLYMLINSDDLARLDEIQRLAGKRLPLALKIFPPSDNLHGQITAIQTWAQESGSGYLPQKVPGGIAAWRMTQKAGLPLWLQLLPFTSSPEQPPANLTRVFMTEDRSLILFRLNELSQ